MHGSNPLQRLFGVEQQKVRPITLSNSMTAVLDNLAEQQR